MVPEETKRFQQCQRIQVEKELRGSEKLLKIIVERYDDCLGWYTAGALLLPLHQLPMLQQSLEEISNSPECGQENVSNKILPFPTLIQEPAEANPEKSILG